MFQEDFTFNKQLKRKCRLRRAYGRYAGTSNWHSWNDNTVTNSYFPYKETTWEDVERNVTVNCDWGTGSNNSYVWVQSGGNTPDNGKSTPFHQQGYHIFRRNGITKPDKINPYNDVV
jgi:hypothetical protein